jgi:hypothetical protein
MARYLLSVHGPTTYGALNSACEVDMTKAFADVDAFNERVREDGHWVFVGSLEPATTATVVDGQGAEPVITDGPYLESTEHIIGFGVIGAPDLDVALRLAAKASKACRGKVEVRPFQSE